MVVVIVAGYSTTTLPLSTPAAVTCPDVDNLIVYDYADFSYFEITYPPATATFEADVVLAGSGGELTLAHDETQKIVFERTDTGFLQISFSVRYAAEVKLTLVKSDQSEVILRQTASTDAVSLRHMTLFDG